MTIPANFPERINQRRKTALYNMQRREPHPAKAEQRALEIRRLEAKIVSSARDVRTKKNRIGHARIK